MSPAQSGTSPRIVVLDGKFLEVQESAEKTNSVSAICKLCQPKVCKIKGSMTSTSNFVSQLKRIHGKNSVEQYKDYVKEKKGEKAAAKAMSRSGSWHNRNEKKFSKTKFDYDITKFVINSLVPLRVVDDPFFEKIFEQFIPFLPDPQNFDVISRRI